MPIAEPTVVVVDVAARTTRLLRTDGPAYGLWWAPDDRSLQYTIPTTPGHLAIRRMRVEGGRAHQLAEIAADGAMWSPDRMRLAWLQWHNPATDLDGIWVLDLADGRQRRVAAWAPGADSWPRWSSDGAWIAFVRRLPDTPDRAGEATIRIVRPDGSDERVLVDAGLGLNPLAVDW